MRDAHFDQLIPTYQLTAGEIEDYIREKLKTVVHNAGLWQIYCRAALEKSDKEIFIFALARCYAITFWLAGSFLFFIDKNGVYCYKQGIYKGVRVQ